ncbi:MAG: type II toxin-antitoxin system RelE/ParE family toxin [Bacteroidetes bacterium]|nr:type II toxin-antitoxin system RelE/ParE family toxin [Bacteroidota bacterium]
MREYLDAVQHLGKYPYAQQEVEHSLRQIRIGRFPCLIIYDIADGKTVIIYRIIHSHTNPVKKRLRK